ncbi:hypothetical protein E7T09_19985 [Deinococcus sp. KSM4-11]|uniref:hypothetical protein n=1 Tax=Deinococcus sp. KSM4-11 TaxID=2568654 RepID=UPI0010A2EBC1|nr:hypothetical protein [Deinococcus sp. KSM4-11]THF84300.1 hypothetical protein E7T09_19985 [Deinococcus sp. KSM4-11]
MKILTVLTILGCSSMSLAATDPCKLLAPGEVKSGLGAPAVTAKPAEGQDFPSCNFDFEGGSLMVQLISPASKFLQGKSLASAMGSGESSFKGLKTVPGLGQDAAGVGGSSVTGGVPQDSAVLFVRRGDVIVMLWAVSSNHAAKKLTLPSVTLLAKRALLRLH